mmetsp:Transcript_74048/g.228870  ORF Transcript_74048/g.228870 Transcript_74048/m.228870 type:complete len:315 (-) Transcript_74048:43-987(-)|eukprot:CAMPEP_0204566486 /NCGR_PEP_ID=MMETSP0661-20131031/36078_1 /ASSEMBLY_ACC=CAM_ASM_000606 /TAXON_ID=109239 /ORGANISM="Alexandrium margalefi, Strain AMGDE01CS-322" /LENGTH=314 /DNA_ID=CAMNT_0051574337 /DNA_START=27 /DNA_END=971 /DNA_ORIENTATION=-
MGAGATAGIAAAATAASDEDLKALVGKMGEAERKKLAEALSGIQEKEKKAAEDKPEEAKKEAKEGAKDPAAEDKAKEEAKEGAKEEKAKDAGDKAKKALIVSTSCKKMDDHETGAWSEEICGPYYVFKDAGYEVSVCSIAGGDVPIDQGSLSDQFKTESDKKMIEEGCKPLKGTPALKDVDVTAYGIVLFAGGHGTCVDFPTEEVGTVLAKAFDAGKVVGTVCHGAMALVKAKAADGEALVKGKKVSCFTDKEEEQVGLTKKVPFLLEAKMKELGAIVEAADAWSDKVVQDGKLVTGQNPQSSVSVAKLAVTLA